MSQISNYNWDFVSRSRKLIANNYDSLVKQDLEVTLLVNCMISLICLIESSREEGLYVNQNLFAQFLSSYKFRAKYSPLDWGVEETINGEAFLLDGLGDNNCFKAMEVKKILKVIRNSLAHQHIKPINVDGVWFGIRIWNKIPHTERIDFVLEINNIELKNLYNSLADIHHESVSA